MKEILVDQNGYNQFFKELDRLEKLSRSNSEFGSESCENATGDGWHDNFSFEESMRESRTLAKRIDDMLAQQRYLKIIDDTNKDKDLVNIGDTVKIEIKYDENDIEKEIITLTGNYIPNINNEINEISLNSPLGKVLYKASIGSSTSYFVNDLEIFVTILNKENI